MTDKRALRFTGDACEQLLIPWDAGRPSTILKHTAPN